MRIKDENLNFCRFYSLPNKWNELGFFEIWTLTEDIFKRKISWLVANKETSLLILHLDFFAFFWEFWERTLLKKTVRLVACMRFKTPIKEGTTKASHLRIHPRISISINISIGVSIAISIGICICLDLRQHSHLRQEQLSLFPNYSSRSRSA